MSFFKRQWARMSRLIQLSAVVALSLSFSLPARSQKQNEAGSGGGQGSQGTSNPQDVWETILNNKIKSPITASPGSPGLNAAGKPLPQEEQRFCFGGFCDHCGLIDLKTENFMKKLCSEAAPKMGPQKVCTENESAQRCAYAAQLYSIPSVVLLCSWGVKDNVKLPPIPEGEKKEIAMTKDQKAAEDKHLAEARKKYEKLINGPSAKKDAKAESKDADHICHDRAASARQYIDTITPAYWGSNFLHNAETPCDYLKFAALITINEYLGADAANKLVQAGENGMRLSGKALNDMKPLIDAMLDCMGKVAVSVDAPDKMVKGSCPSGSIYN